ncbi:MAG: aldo/keto reductase [Pseudomonadota bacterium]
MTPSNSDVTRRHALILGAAAGLSLTGSSAGAAEPKIETRPIPSSGEALPIVGLGTSGTFNIGTDPDERAQRREVLEVLFAGGGSVIDTSPMYGRAERVVGDLLVQMGAEGRAFLATKVWTRGQASGISQMEESRRLLRHGTIDLMQVHNLVDTEAHLETLREWKAKGLIRYIGITHYTAAALDDLARVIERHELDFVQFAYSIFDRAAERRMLPLIAERGVASLINRPFDDGRMFRKVKGVPLPAFAEELGIESWAQYFLKYILAHPAATCVIPGTSKPKHMADNLAAGRGPLPDAAQRKEMISYLAAI